MYLENLHITYFRGIEAIDLPFRKDLNIIIGENNSGKTAILDALRICLGLGYQRRDIRVRSEDFFIDRLGNKSTTIKFDLTFTTETEEENGIFVELLALGEHDKPELQLHVEFSREGKNGEERIRLKYWGGENEGQRLPEELLDLFYFVHLGALRNSDRDLMPSASNRLGRLFLKLVDNNDEQKSYAEKLNKVVDDDESWKKLRGEAKERINEHLVQASIGAEPQQIDIDFVSLEFKKIVEQLKVFLPFIGAVSKDELNRELKKVKDGSDGWRKYFENPHDEVLRIKDEFTRLITIGAYENGTEKAVANVLKNSFRKFEVSQNGLGYNNLIFIATVLGDILERKRVETETYVSLLIEEPEAHLHPQLQNTLFNYFQKLHSKNIQVFITSHSPTITAKTDIDSILVVKRDGNKINATPLRTLNLKEKNKKYLKRFLDVTKSQLFFANGIVLVEGISEALLLPVFANMMGEEYNLDKKGIEVVNIGGVAFEPFAELLNFDNKMERLDVPCAIVTDDDRNNVQNSTNGGPSSRAQKAKELEEGQLKVFLAKRNLEYELYSANEGLAISLYKKLHKNTQLESNKDLETRWEDFSHKVKNNKDKAEFAQLLAEHLQENKQDAKNFTVPSYLQNAIRWVIDGSTEDTNRKAERNN